MVAQGYLRELLQIQPEKTLYVGHIPLKITDRGCTKSAGDAVAPLDPASLISGVFLVLQLLFRMFPLFLCLGELQSS